jgi:hypothetical protein
VIQARKAATVVIMPVKPTLRKARLGKPEKKTTETYTVLVASLSALKLDAEDSDSACKRAMDLSHMTGDQISKAAILDDRVVVSRVASVTPKSNNRLDEILMSEMVSHAEFDQRTCDRLVDLIAAPKDSATFIAYDHLEKVLMELISHIKAVHAFGCDSDLHAAGDQIVSALNLVKDSRLKLIKRAQGRPQEIGLDSMWGTPRLHRPNS